ncbi:unnamed protein product [Durusdinium trenchii]|uniref:Transmembrane protein 222 n=1 Tax=Durusdinium trenchii TaxID=1381693 RepID=A0ABP0J3G2_9DINO
MRGPVTGIGATSQVPRPTVMEDSEEGYEVRTPRSFDGQVDVDQDLYPLCIVWTPIHGCTWCFPFVGHMGIGTADGQVMEFMGFGATKAPRGGLSFGPVCRYVQLSTRKVRKGTWDDAIHTATIKECFSNRDFATGPLFDPQVEGRPHGGCISNCHSFVADCLHEMRYAGVPCWNWLSYVLAVWVFVFGHFTTCPRTAVYVIPVAFVLAILYFLWK